MNNTYRILQGHFLDVAREIPDASVQVCATSPPYYGLRSYNTEPQVWGGSPDCPHTWQGIKQFKESWRRGESSAGFYDDRPGRTPGRCRTAEELKSGRWTHTQVCGECDAWLGELGQEPSPALYVKNLVAVFAEVWRTLRADGCLWVNIGDAYYNYRPGVADDARASGIHRERKTCTARDMPSFTARRGYKIADLKEKDLIGLPWMFAFAMRDFGWYLRQECIWSKPNPLPESVEDRPSRSHEQIFLFTKSERYYYDKWAVLEPQTGNAHPRGRAKRTPSPKVALPESGIRNNTSFEAATRAETDVGGRNARSVWTMTLQGYDDAHYAGFPESLPQRCILAGSSELGCCPTCGAPWIRIVEKQKHYEGGSGRAGRTPEEANGKGKWAGLQHGDGLTLGPVVDVVTIGWKKGCKCPIAKPVPCTVLDPFTGRGTTGVVAVRFGRDFVGAELQGKYVPMIRKNLNGEAPLWVNEATS